MPFLRALVQIPRDTLVDEDVVTNTWHFDVDNGTAAAAAAEAQNALDTFYAAMDTYLNNRLVGDTATVDWYNLADAIPRVPVYSDTIALTTTAPTTDMPPELAAVLSFRGAEASGVNMRRRKGRIYFGPLGSQCFTLVSGRVEFTTTFMTDLKNAAASVMAYTGTLGVSWAVFSPTTLAEGGTLDQSFEDVVAGWVDSEPDIQRRRGRNPGRTRQVWP